MPESLFLSGIAVLWLSTFGIENATSGSWRGALWWLVTVIGAGAAGYALGATLA